MRQTGLVSDDLLSRTGDLGLVLSRPPADPARVESLATVLWVEASRHVENLPAFPRHALDILEAARRDADLEELLPLVDRDAAVGLQLLRAANSASSASRAPVRTIRDAAVRLGARTSAAVAAAAATRTLRAMPPAVRSSRYRTLWDWLWAHSATTSVTAADLAARTGAAEPGAALLLGLFHELGALPCILALTSRDAASLGELDQAGLLWLLDRLHVELGGLLATRMQLPADVIGGVRRHHDPSDDERVLHVVRLVSLVGALSTAMCVRPSALAEIAASLQVLGLELDELGAITRSLQDSAVRLFSE